MSASGGIHGHLLKLHQSLSDEDQRAAAFECHDVVGDLAQECLETTTENKLGERSVLMSTVRRQQPSLVAVGEKKKLLRT